jgi:cytochrome b6-f complex iron-sulfur subunit
MPAAHYLTRRTVLCAGGAGAAGLCVFVLTGCSSGSSASATTSAPPSTGSASAEGSTSSGGATSADGATSAGRATSASSGGGGEQVAKLSDIPVGGSISATLDGKPIILAQPSTGKVVAFTAICTHQGCTVNPDGAVLRCPCHASTYDAFTGKNTSGPAQGPLAAIPVTVSGGAVLASA